MFEKKTYLYSENMGVCFVEDITKLVTAQKKEVLYYVLRPVYQKDKTGYIPVENHSVELRELISEEEAKKLLFSYSELIGLAEELGLVEKQDEEEEALQTVDPAEEKEQERKRLAIRYKMADTLPFEERSALYQRGEIEFVLRRAFLQEEEGKKKRKKKT
ncbi:MAG: CarD family transcriptional regulator [Lachnospiraceae bacterium]|nr:CarD family transcriptional regulator [Lachnospiraceae bacterium]